LVVRATKGKIGRQQIAVRDWHEPENDAARIDLHDAPQPRHGGPEIALDVVMDAVGATVARHIGASLDAL
jgi:hypothetical protein